MAHPVVAARSTSRSASARVAQPPLPVRLRVRRLLARGLWLAAVLLTSCGGAGILAAADHLPGTTGRAELTWGRDAVVKPALDRAQQDLVALSLEVNQLDVQGRGILVALANRDSPTVDAALAAGAALDAVIGIDSGQLTARLEGLVGSGPSAEIQVSVAQLIRREAALDALDSTRGIHEAWSRLAAAAAAASRLTGLLTAHDTTVAQAAGQGRAQAYGDALITIATAKLMLDEATRLRDQVANVSEVSTLDEWIRRNRAYDEALEALYIAVRASGGQVTPATSDAITAEAAARAQLPPDTRGLVLIVSEMSQGGLNQAVAAIRQAGEQLKIALDGLP